jgi:hypothetical protein
MIDAALTWIPAQPLSQDFSMMAMMFCWKTAKEWS